MGTLHQVIVSTGLKQRVHETVNKPIVKLCEISLLQGRNKYRKACDIVDQQYALATLDQ